MDDAAHVIRIVRGISDEEIVDRPKTENAVRAVPLTDEVRTALDAHRRELLRRQPPSIGGGWIFPATSRTGPRSLNWGYLALRKVVRVADVGRRLTASGLRRSWIDAARRAALDPVVVRQVIGHADDQMRGWYSTVEPDEILAAGASVARLITGGSGPKSGPSEGETPRSEGPAVVIGRRRKTRETA